MKKSDWQNRVTAAIDGLPMSQLDYASLLFAQAATANRLIHAFGVDARAADIQGELFFRVNGLVNIDPIYDPSFANAHGAYRSELCRQLRGIAPRVLEYYESIQPGDLMVIIGLDGNSIALAEASLWAKNNGLLLVTVTPEEPSEPEVAKLSDAPIYVGVDFPTITMTAALDYIMDSSVQLATEAPVWRGQVFPDLVSNRNLIDTYLWKVRHL